MCINCESTGKPIAAVWWRVSTKAQEETSPDTQIQEAREMLEAEGCGVPEEYVFGSAWHSLSILDCPAMESLIDAIRRKNIHAVGMYHGDRLAGNPAQKAFIMELAERQGVKLFAKHSPIIEGREGELVEYVRTWGKEQQVLRAQQAAKDGLRDRVKLRGLLPSGRCPYGYEYAVNGNDHTQDYTRLVPTADWPTAKFIWQRAIEGAPLRMIARELYGRGVRTPTGKDIWRPGVIDTMLHNPTYTGRVYGLRHRTVIPERRRRSGYGKTTAKMRPVEEWVRLQNIVVERPVVTWDEYQAVQDRLIANKKNSSRNTKNEYLLRSFIRCEAHGTVYKSRRNNGRNHNVYLCCGYYNNAVKINPCARLTIGGWIESEVWDKAVGLLSDPERILGEIERRRQAQTESEAHIQEALQSVDRRLSKTDDKELKLVSLRLNDDVGETVFARQKALIRAERTWCNEERERLQGQLEQVRQRFATMEQIQVLQQRIGNKLNNATFEDKRFVLEALETHISVAEDGSIKLLFAVPIPEAEEDESVSAIPRYTLRPTGDEQHDGAPAVADSENRRINAWQVSPTVSGC